MNFGAQRSRFSHLSMALKIFRIKTKQCKILCSPLKGHSPAMRTVDSSGITSSVSTEHFHPLPMSLPCSEPHCPPPCGSTLWAASKAQMSPQPVAQGQRGWLHMSRASVPSHSVHLLQLLLLAGEHLLQEHCMSRKELAPEGWWGQQNVGCKCVDLSWRSRKGCRSKCRKLWQGICALHVEMIIRVQWDWPDQPKAGKK